MFDKLMNRMFRKVENVVFDLTANSIGIRRGESIFTMGEDGSLNENMFADMSAPIPAFAKSIKLADVKVGDLVIAQDGEPFGFITAVNPKSLRVLKPTGTCSTVVPSKVNLLGQGQTVMVVTPITTAGGIDPMMLMAMSDDSEDTSKMLMMMSMLQGGQTGEMNPMMMMAMMKGSDGEGSKDFMKMMMLQQMMGQGGQGDANQMNPMMLMMLMGK